MNFDLSGTVALVTGASSGLGRHFALTLAKAGAKVAVAARRQMALTDLAAEIKAFDGRAMPIAMDVTDRDQVERGLLEAETELGPVTIVVNNAGIALAGPALSLSPEDWQKVLATDLTGVWNVAQLAAQRLVHLARGGSIINVASIIGLAGGSQLSAYSAAKAGVINLTRTLAVEWARHGIRVNALAPGYIETALNRDTLKGEVGEVMKKKIPQRRFGQPADLDGALLLLASEASAYMTGSVIVVDGGQHAVM